MQPADLRPVLHGHHSSSSRRGSIFDRRHGVSFHPSLTNPSAAATNAPCSSSPATSPPGRCGQVFGDEVVAAAMIDGLVHHAESSKATAIGSKTATPGALPPSACCRRTQWHLRVPVHRTVSLVPVRVAEPGRRRARDCEQAPGETCRLRLLPGAAGDAQRLPDRRNRGPAKAHRRAGQPTELVDRAACKRRASANGVRSPRLQPSSTPSAAVRWRR